MEDADDEALLPRIKAHDHQAFSILVKRHSKRFFIQAWRMTGEEAVAEEITQEAFLKLWDKPQSWRPGQGAKFTTWMTRVVMNLCTDHLRRKKFTAPGGLPDERYLPFDAQRDARFTDEQAALERAIQALPERQRAALNLCFYEDMSQRDAAGALGVGVKALESLLSRAKAGVRDYLLKEGYDV